MNGLQFTLTLIGQLISWPVAILVVALVFRKPLSELISRIKSYEGLGQKVSFGDRLAQTEESVDRAVGSIKHEAGVRQLEPPAEEKQVDADEFTALVREAEANPSYAVLVAWEQLTGAIDDLVGASLGAERFPRRNSPIQLRELERREVVHKDFARAVTNLRDLRNRVAHGQHNPTSGEAVAYVESAKELTRASHVLANLAMRKGPPTDAAR